VPPEDDYLRAARVITVIATILFALVLVGIVLALVLR
jgi:tetrahydromethanopterin S-methyltransferase subunit F